MEGLIDKFRGCLVGGAAGDALGYAVEFCRWGDIREEYGREGIQEYKLKSGEALISDDTQMTLFTAAGLLSGKARGMDFADSVGLAYKGWHSMQVGSDPIRDYGSSYS